MKINGVVIAGSCIELIVIPRGDGRPPVVFKAQAVLDFEEFNKLVPQPKPNRTILKKGGEKVPDFNDKIYLGQMDEYNKKQQYFLFIKSLLLGTPGLEFEFIQLTDPETWLKFDEEFKNAGFSSVEINRIIQGVMAANCLDEAKIKEARDSFGQTQAEPEALPQS